jgi:hypothetical protein
MREGDRGLPRPHRAPGAEQGLPRAGHGPVRRGHPRLVPRAGLFRLPGLNAEFDTVFRYSYSPSHSDSVFDYDMETRQSTLLKERPSSAASIGRATGRSGSWPRPPTG